MLNVRDVARELSVSATCVYQLIAAGKLACHRIGVGRGAIRVSEKDLAEFVESCRRDTKAMPTVQAGRRIRRPKFKHLRLDG
jgi:excisionase family DNA binding protein